MIRRLIVYISVLFLFSCKETGQENNYQSELSENWKIQSSKLIESGIKNLSKPDFDDNEWITGIVPGTVLNSLVKAGEYSDIYFDKNLEKIDTSRFSTSWYYRNVFTINNLDVNTILIFEGINYRANVWLNGIKITDAHSEIKNAFRQFQFDVSKKLRGDENVLLVEVFPPKPGDFSIGFVDWNPAPPDKNMGIFRRVLLKQIKGVRVNHSFVESKLNDSLTEADLYITTELSNKLNRKVNGSLRISTNDFVFEKNLSLEIGEMKVVKLNPSEFPALRIKNPGLWWPHTIGKPNLYNVKVEFILNGEVSDKEELKHGIRKLESYFTDEDHRGIMINGQKISIRGGGWVDDLTLNDTPDFIRSQLEYVKNMNLNTIRLEGFWGKDHTLYDICDELGILVMVGWSCQWEWESYLGKVCDEKYGGILSDDDIIMMSHAWKDQILWLRNHPSIFAWLGGSDCIPHPLLEQNYFKVFEQFDSTRIYLASAKEWKSLAGPSGVKMRGPYAYEPPIYWFSDTLFGGAFGFNTETGPGAQIPPLESIKKMIPHDKLWPINQSWEYHCGRHSFGTLARYKNAFDKRYGEAKSVEEFAFKAQAMNYELMRPMFEAFSINRYKATGLIQWMLNSAWPEMYWQLYDSYLMPNGAYYGAQKAGEPIHLVYNYQNKSVYLVNDKLVDKEDFKITIKVFDINSKLIFEKQLNENIKANKSEKVFKLPDLKGISATYFLSLKIEENDRIIDDNFYWLSTKADVLDYQAEVPGWNFYTPSKAFADFTMLNQLEKVQVEYTVSESEAIDYKEFTAELKNTSKKIAFFIEAKIIDEKDGLTILPVLWTDNYISILPDEIKRLEARIKKTKLQNTKVKFVLSGWNLEE